MMNESIDTVDLSTEVVLNIFRDGLRTAADDPAQPFQDPNESQRPEGSPFVLTSYPQQNEFFPLVIVEEFDDKDRRIDAQADLFQHDYTIRITIYSETNTDLYHIRDQIRHFVESNFVQHMHDGFSDSSIESSNAANWEDIPEVLKWELIVSGVVHTKTT